MEGGRVSEGFGRGFGGKWSAACVPAREEGERGPPDSGGGPSAPRVVSGRTGRTENAAARRRRDDVHDEVWEANSSPREIFGCDHVVSCRE
jgi:hypothetical protein